MKSFVFRLLCFLVFLLLFLELFYRFVIPASHPPYRLDRAGHSIHCLDPAYPDGIFTFCRLAENRIPWHVNSQGFNAGIEYEERLGRKTRLVGIFGDSYVEGLHVCWENNIASQLKERLPSGWNVYNFGLGGISLSHCQNVIAYAEELFQPETAVIEVSKNSLRRSIANFERWPLSRQYLFSEDSLKALQSTPYRESRKRLLRNSALVRYLNLNAQMELRLPGHADRSYSPYGETQYQQQVAERLVADLAQAFPNVRLILLCDANRDAIYDLDASRITMSETLLLEPACKKHGLELIDLAKPFFEDYLKHGERLDFDGESHWNARAHRLAAEALVKHLQVSSEDGQVLDQVEMAPVLAP